MDQSTAPIDHSQCVQCGDWFPPERTAGIPAGNHRYIIMCLDCFRKFGEEWLREDGLL